MKTLNDIVNWIIQSGLLVWLFYFGFAIGKPWIDSKIKHAKTQQQKEVWSLLEQIAMTAVDSLVNSNKSGEQKFDTATKQVATYLSDHDIKVDMKTVQSAVQAAYEKSSLTSAKPIAKPAELQGTVVDGRPTADPVLQAIETAPNRANDVKEG